MPRITAFSFALILCACTDPTVDAEGQLGRPIPLLTGDASPLPRLMFVDEGCPGEVAIGGCPLDGDRGCAPMLLDSLLPVTTFRNRNSGAETLSMALECMELRSSAGLAADSPSAQDLERAVARLRLRQVPTLRAASAGTDEWNWLAGDERTSIEPAGALGGNVLSDFAVQVAASADVPSVSFYSEFPGSDRDLARQGWSFLPVQFPGRLLGRAADDRCDIGGQDCDLPGVTLLPGNEQLALVSTRMVMDVCVAAPPCTVRYVTNAEDAFQVGVCGVDGRNTRGPDSEQACEPARLGGRAASLVVATGVSGLVLFDDSVERMFGEAADIPTCDAITPSTPACVTGDDGVLHFTGWPSAGEDGGLPRMLVRSVAIVPGATRTKSDGPCERVDTRLDAAFRQCDRYHDAARQSILDVSPPYSAVQDAKDNEGQGERADSSVAVLGEAFYAPGTTAPNPDQWIEAQVLPANHPLALTVRRDVAPDAIQPDGLLGTVLFQGTDTVLDYTDPNPGLRIRCLEPAAGPCMVLPDCRTDGDPACCHGMPRALVAEIIEDVHDDVCCSALSAADLADIQARGPHCLGYDPP